MYVGLCVCVYEHIWVHKYLNIREDQKVSDLQ